MIKTYDFIPSDAIISKLNYINLDVPTKAPFSYAVISKKSEGFIAIHYEAYAKCMTEGCRGFDEQVDTFGKHIRPGRFLRQLIPTADDKTVEQFASLFKPFTEIIITKDITKAYQRSPPRSCMSKQNMSFYEDNGVKIVLMMDRDVLLARALLWPDIYFPALDMKLPLLDRIYSVDGTPVLQMKAFAAAKNYVVRKSNGPIWRIAKEHILFEFEDAEFYDEIYFPLRTYRSKYMPWIDTFNGGKKEGDSVILSNSYADKSYCFDLQHEGGKNTFLDTGFSKHHGFEIPLDKSSVYLTTHEDWVLVSDTVIVGKTAYLKSECFTCVSCDASFLKKGGRISIGGDLICKKCGHKITDGKHKGRYGNNSEIVQLSSGKTATIYDECITIGDKVLLKNHTLQSPYPEKHFEYVGGFEENAAEGKVERVGGRWAFVETYDCWEEFTPTFPQWR